MPLKGELQGPWKLVKEEEAVQSHFVYAAFKPLDTSTHQREHIGSCMVSSPSSKSLSWSTTEAASCSCRSRWINGCSSSCSDGSAAGGQPAWVRKMMYRWENANAQNKMYWTLEKKQEVTKGLVGGTKSVAEPKLQTYDEQLINSTWHLRSCCCHDKVLSLSSLVRINLPFLRQLLSAQQHIFLTLGEFCCRCQPTAG